jgi:hypothetical protein
MQEFEGLLDVVEEYKYGEFAAKITVSIKDDKEIDVFPIKGSDIIKGEKIVTQVLGGCMIFSDVLNDKDVKSLEKYKIDKIAYKHRYYACYNLDNKKKNSLIFIMFNPSTANPYELDPTIKNCILLASKDYGKIEIINLYSYRNSKFETIKQKSNCLLSNKCNERFIEKIINDRKKQDNNAFVLAWGYGKETGWEGKNLNNLKEGSYEPKKPNDLIQKVKDWLKDYNKTYTIGVNVNEINTYNHHPAPSVWNGMGEFEKIATLIEC